VFELARAELREVGAANEGKNNVSGKPLFNGRLEAKGVRRVDQDACVLRGNYGVDDRRQIVDVGEGFDAEDNIVEWAFATGGRLLWRAHNCNIDLVREAEEEQR
jgi:hypothetical protein